MARRPMPAAGQGPRLCAAWAAAQAPAEARVRSSARRSALPRRAAGRLRGAATNPAARCSPDARAFRCLASRQNRRCPGCRRGDCAVRHAGRGAGAGFVVAIAVGMRLAALRVRLREALLRRHVASGHVHSPLSGWREALRPDRARHSPCSAGACSRRGGNGPPSRPSPPRPPRPRRRRLRPRLRGPSPFSRPPSPCIG